MTSDGADVKRRKPTSTVPQPRDSVDGAPPAGPGGERLEQVQSDGARPPAGRPVTRQQRRRRNKRYAWQEQALTRIYSVRAGWEAVLADERAPAVARPVRECAEMMLANAEEACTTRPGFRGYFTGAPSERAWTNVHEAEALLLTVTPPERLPGLLPKVADDVQTQLMAACPQRQEIERLLERSNDPDGSEPRFTSDDALKVGLAALSARHLSAAAHLRVRSFRNVVQLATFLLFVAVVLLALVAAWRPAALPMCTGDLSQCLTGSQPRGWDVTIVAALGAAAGLLAGVVAIRNVRGTSTPYAVPVALGFLKCPTGALSAVLGILLLRAGFGDAAFGLGSSAGLIAWAIVLGAAQQLVTRLADLQGQDVLNKVRSGTTGPRSDDESTG